MLRRLAPLFAAALLFAAPAARADDDRLPSIEEVQTLLELTAMDLDFLEIARWAEALAKSPETAPEIVPAWRKAARRAFAFERMWTDLTAALLAGFDREMIETGIAFHQSDLGRALAAAHQRTYFLIEEDPEAFEPAGRALLAGMTEENAARFRELLELHGFTRVAKSTAAQIRRLYRDSSYLAAPPGTEPLIREALETLFPLLSQWVRDELELTSAHTLAQLDAAELEALLDISRRPEAQRSEHRINKAYFLIYDLAIDRFLILFARALAASR